MARSFVSLQRSPLKIGERGQSEVIEMKYR